MPPPPSFRDPAGSLFHSDGRIFRMVNEDAMPDFSAFFASAAAARLLEQGRIPATRVATGQGSILEHERLPFVSYPTEWPPEMLHAAAALTLDIAEAILPEGFGLKDATPYNILWRGPEPVFVDLLSFERRNPLDATWLALAQFQRTFLLPLLANDRFRIPLDQVFTTRRDGLQPEELYRWAGMPERFSPPFLTQVSIPTWIGRRMRGAPGLYRPRLLSDAPKAQYVLRSLFARLRRGLERVRPKAKRSSEWSDYAMAGNRYGPEQAAAKEEFVSAILRRFRPARVLDMGCNTGHFSALAAREGAAVTAIDSDPVVAGAVWRRARAGSLAILPMTLNIARPTPATGWRNQEQASFLDRAHEAFDCVMMLALVHHLLVTEGIPMIEIVRLAADLTTDLAILEFVGAEDAMFLHLTRGREHLHREATSARFEECCRDRFEILQSLRLPDSYRIMYALRKK